MPLPTAQERKCLKAIAEARACDHIKVSRKVGITSDYADQLCRYLLKWGYVQRFGRRYQLTKAGEEAAAKEMERESQKAGKGKADTGEERLVWDRWLGGFKAVRQGGEGMFPEEGLVWETYRGLGGRGAPKKRSLPELLREERYQCAFCGGEGQSPPGTKCPVCKGNGSVAIFQPPAVKCGYCKGTGRKEPRVHITCIVCRGKGVVAVKEPIEICPACQGKGYSTEDRLPCTFCKGKGVVTTKERILQ